MQHRWVLRHEAVLSEQPSDVARGTVTVPVTTAAAIWRRCCRNELVILRAKVGMIHYEMRVFLGSQGVLVACLPEVRHHCGLRGLRALFRIVFRCLPPPVFATSVGYICEFDGAPPPPAPEQTRQSNADSM